MRCSSDLRKRVIEFVRCGGSKAEAARRFQVSAMSVHRWVKPDGLTYKRPGPRSGHKLDREALQRHVEEHNDMTQAERARHFGVSRHCIWHNLQRLKVSCKKNDDLS
jgi:transposase